MPIEHQCPKCGATLSAEAAKGLCPRCLLAAALGPAIAAAGQPTIRIELSAEDEPSERIDRYKILQKLGEGGCGVVYMAEQTEPVRRRVALKVIKLGMDTKQVIARFEAERQALALMDHPNIAKVLDAGATATGRPYFVMELVKGIRITDYCDQHHLATSERLGLFTQVCQAIQHAHQKGIIHRDIKPSNILVTLHDGVPVPKVIDFGIAKATEQALTEKTVFTAFGQFMGTPAYMSPEQAELSGLDIDTRSDIYALGVLLYELLTGKTPFDAKELLQAGLDEMRRRIREEEPMRPSTRLSTMTDADLTEVAQHRQSESAKLTRFIRGDLDWIVMKCLEKDRNRRYETANGLATDLKRHLNNEPVLACPPSAAYRFQKLIRRNRIAFAAVASVVTALVVGLGIAAWQFIEKSKAYNRAVAAEKLATTEANKSRQVAQFLKDMLSSVGPSKARGRDTKMLQEVLDQTALRLGNELAGQPAVECELRRVLGRTYNDLGQYSNALVMAQEALRLSRSLFGVESLAVADGATEVGSYQVNMGDWLAAEANHKQALAIRRRVLGEEHADVAQSILNVGIVLVNEGKREEAEKMLRQALEMWKKLDLKEDQQVLRGLKALSSALRRQGRLDEAEEYSRKALSLSRNLFGEVHPEMVSTLIGLANIQADQNNARDAETNFLNALAVAKKLGWEAHPYVAAILSNLGAVLQSNGKLVDAETVGSQALAMKRKLSGNENPSVAASLVNLGVVQLANRKLSEAEDNLQEAVAIFRKLPANDPADLAAALDGLGNVLRERGKLAEALKSHRELLEIERSQPPTQAHVADALSSLSLTLLASGEPLEAERIARECLTLREQEVPRDWPVFYARSLLGGTMMAQAKYVEAEDLVVGGYRGMKERADKLPFDGKAYFEQAGERVVGLYRDWGKPDKAAEWRATVGPTPLPAR